uniref:Uncharacterized protein n=1 Tax=Candidatus Kentrum sp. FW TaxID=2126338 RepID=A0A450SC88_9GAMM|nr:MAG: hypothetical protein BECKFW1821B_GA0114236_10067 [Candidatus Kentron sp. FW]
MCYEASVPIVLQGLHGKNAAIRGPLRSSPRDIGTLCREKLDIGGR